MNKVYFVYREFDSYERSLDYVFSNKESAEAYAGRRNVEELADAEADELDGPMYTYYVEEMELYDKDPYDTK